VVYELLGHVVHARIICIWDLIGIIAYLHGEVLSQRKKLGVSEEMGQLCSVQSV